MKVTALTKMSLRNYFKMIFTMSISRETKLFLLKVSLVKFLGSHIFMISNGGR